MAHISLAAHDCIIQNTAMASIVDDNAGVTCIFRDSKEEEEIGPSLLDLPRAVLVHSFRHLSLRELLCTATVCSSFRTLAEEALEEVDILNLEGCHGIQTVNAVKWLSNSKHLLQLRSLSVQGAGSAEALRLLADSASGRAKLSTLTHLTIDAVKALNDVQLENLLRHTPHLQNLDISNNKVSGRPRIRGDYRPRLAADAQASRCSIR
jgi:hypothetical protein